MKRTIGEQVAQYMEDEGLKAAAMAKLCGTSRQNIEGLTKRNRFPRGYIGNLAGVMGVSVDALLAGTAYSGKSSQKKIDDSVSMSKDIEQVNVKGDEHQGTPEESDGNVADNESATRKRIPTSMPPTATNLKSAILLMGSLIGALDGRRRRHIRDLLNDLIEQVDNRSEVEDIAEMAYDLALKNKPISKNNELNKALRGRPGRDPVETKPAPLEH